MRGLVARMLDIFRHKTPVPERLARADEDNRRAAAAVREAIELDLSSVEAVRITVAAAQQRLRNAHHANDRS